jgi:GrpB-like predicted nucleotidyltransferase (UPF0157 family)
VGLPDPNDVEAYDELLAEVTIGGAEPLSRPIEIRDYDPAWPAQYELEAAQIREALGERALRLEHAGSTAVPGLPAKPIVDVILEVQDSAAEETYLPDLEQAGYYLHIREHDWFEHRELKRRDRSVHLHVFTVGCEEVEAMLRFRDHLRVSAADRELYAATKRELAAHDWKYGQQYADAKSAVIREILACSKGSDTTR